MKQIILCSVLLWTMCSTVVFANDKEDEIQLAIAFGELKTNPDRAFRIFEEVETSSGSKSTSRAKSNHAYAQLGMGICLYYGLGCKQDYKGAFQRFRQLVVYPSGFANANPMVEYYYGECLYNGHGTPKDTEGGLRGIQYAARYGFADARIRLGTLMLVGEIGANKEYFGWVKNEADNNNKDAQYIVGQLYLKGIGCVKDEITGNEYIQKSRK